MKNYSLGIDLGSSSVKVSVFDTEKGESIGSSFYPEQEMGMLAEQPGWAEQPPEKWWDYFLEALKRSLKKADVAPSEIACIGISYQMHGLVVVDQDREVIRPSIIWCDSRAVAIGDEAYEGIGSDYCDQHLLNSPGNFTASKLKWVKDHEPENYSRTAKFMLPGDYLAYRLSGEITTTATGLSEGIFWDFDAKQVSDQLMSYYGFGHELLPEIVPAFSKEVKVSGEISEQLGIKEGVPISYRAGDQPNNAFSLNVLHPGEVAATAGTSGVIYAVTDKNISDEHSRINTFLHVNDQSGTPRNGLLLCVNGTGSLNSWIKSNMAGEETSYDQMNREAADLPIGADGLRFYPFGNGAERLLRNKELGAQLLGLEFNRHSRAHLYRAGQEGIVYALKYGFDLLEDLGLAGDRVRAGKANMFLSPLFREVFANTTGATIQLYNTDGAEGAARGAALGAGLYGSEQEAFARLACLETIEPQLQLQEAYLESYERWKEDLEKQLDH